LFLLRSKPKAFFLGHEAPGNRLSGLAIRIDRTGQCDPILPWHLSGIRKTAVDAYLRCMFKAFEFCLPTNATKIRAGVRSDFNWNRQPVSVMGYR
jgi:hypothetical protein